MKKYILFYFLGLISISSYSQTKVHISSEKYYYSIDTISNAFHKTSIIKGYHQQEKYIHSFYYGELDRILSSTAYSSDLKKRSKLPKQNHFQSRVLSNNFYAGISSYNLQFDHKNSSVFPQWFEIEMKQESNEIIRLASLNFYKSKEEHIDTILHEIVLPSSHVLNYSVEDVVKIKHIKIDSIKNDFICTYRFEKIFSRNESTDSNYFKGIRCIVTKRNTSAYHYLNSWYQTMIISIPLSEKYKLICDSITKNQKDSSLIIKSIYDYVKQSIRYIDIENGINAFKPRACDEVIYNKYGDCKDMAYLIQKMLEYKGIDAYLALSSTSSHEYQFNFPSIASADHLICIAKLGSKNYYLDATEKYGMYHLPSRQIINTAAFMIDPEHPKTIHIPSNDAQHSKELRYYDLTVDANGIYGTAKIICTGYSMIELESMISYSSKNQLNKLLESYCNQKGYNTQYKNFKIERTDTSIQILCDLIIKSTVLSQIQNKFYMDLSFLPNPLPYIAAMDSTAREINLNFNTTYITDFKINFEKPIGSINSPFKFFKINNEDMRYEFQINKKTNNLEIRYSLITKKEKYNKNEFKKFKENSLKIATTLNHEISIL